MVVGFIVTIATAQTENPRPNILWLSSEDHGPHMGSYGDELATTPHVDALASRGLRYDRAWSNAPVCAPARTALISGLYPQSSGSQHMRSYLPAPANKPFYPEFLRDAGYYCTNNSKTDYNLVAPTDLWAESSTNAHWQNRNDNQPFFAIFNAFVSHESRLRIRPHEPLLDASRITPPPYHPNEPAVRKDWAQYYDTVTLADAAAGRRLAELAEAGLSEDTIVFYFGDHGSGMPGSKRNPNNAGLHVPLIVYIPEKFAHLRPDDYEPGGASDRLVSFVDFAPTLLSLIGITPPDWMQGHAFLGEHIAPRPDFIHGFRGRMDERTDFVRSITDGRYVYVRNFRPDLPAGQFVGYQFRTPTTRIWYDQFVAGQTTPVQSAFWLPTPPEQLYDLHADPHETRNLAEVPALVGVKRRLHAALVDHAREIRDLGFWPEALIHARSAGLSPYDHARQRAAWDPSVIEFADIATLGRADDFDVLAAGLNDNDAVKRYWALRGLLIHDLAGSGVTNESIAERLRDDSPVVRVAAAEVLAHRGRQEGLDTLVRLADPAENNLFISIAALGALDRLGPAAASIHPAVAAFEREAPNLPSSRYSGYIGSLITHLLGEHRL